jgi:hypothetical protein
MVDVTFVTSVYDELFETEFAGRNNRGSHYAFSLTQIHRTEAPIYCYTDQYNIKKFLPPLLAYGCDKTRFFNFDLGKYQHHAEILKIKGEVSQYVEQGAWQQRCVEIMWGKFDMLIHAAETTGIAPDKYLFWLDAGLSHDGILPPSYNTEYIPHKIKLASLDYQYRFQFDKIFNKNLPQYLVDYMGDNKLLFCFCSMSQHNDPSPLPNTKIGGTSVGGLFGGDIETVYRWAKKGKEVCAQLIEERCLIKEEDILSHLIDQNEEDPVKLYTFTTWYHEGWGDKIFMPDKGHVSFANLFKGML